MVERGPANWRSAVLAGVIAGLIMGLVLDFGLNAMPLIGALYGSADWTAGWIAHLVHSVVFALLYAAIVTFSPLAAWGQRAGTGLGVGIAYGVLLWLVAWSFILPAWLNSAGAASPPVPDFDPIAFIGHLLYGVVLGTAYPGLLWSSTGRPTMPRA